MTQAGGGAEHPRQRGRSVVAAVLVSIVCLGLGAGMILNAHTPDDRATIRRHVAALGKPTTAAARARMTRDARAIINRRPLESRAVSLLGLVKEAEADKAGATKLMSVAGRLSRRDAATNLWLFHEGVTHGRYAEAFENIDAYLRRERREAGQKMLPMVASAASRPGAAPFLAKRLALEPDWRRSFYLTLSGLTAENPGLAFPIMSETLKAGSPPTADELEAHLSRMIAARRYDEAFLQWVLLMPKEKTSKIGYLNDGDFQDPRGAPPFDWNIAAASDATIESAAAYGRQGNALRLGFDALADAKLPAQLVMLTPGRYELSGEFLTETGDSAGRVKWEIACADMPAAPLAEHLASDTGAEWRSFRMTFEIPAAGCPAQWLSAKPTRGLERNAVAVWYDRMAIARLTP